MENWAAEIIILGHGQSVIFTIALVISCHLHIYQKWNDVGCERILHGPMGKSSSHAILGKI